MTKCRSGWLPFKDRTPRPITADHSVLKRQEQRAVHGLSIADIDAVLNAWAALGQPIRLHYLWRPQLRDSDDEMVLEAAINGRADAIITHNTTDFRPAAARFALDVLTPAQFIPRLRREL